MQDTQKDSPVLLANSGALCMQDTQKDSPVLLANSGALCMQDTQKDSEHRTQKDSPATIA
jgi:hypothetical protein